MSNKVKLLLVMFFAIVPALTLSAGEQEDSTAYLFRFVPRKDMFYSPWGGNGAELARLLAAIDRNREAIENGQMYLCVTSYGAQGASGERISKTRRNRVKSELIVRGRIKEMNFVTDKNVGEWLFHTVMERNLHPHKVDCEINDGDGFDDCILRYVADGKEIWNLICTCYGYHGQWKIV